MDEARGASLHFPRNLMKRLGNNWLLPISLTVIFRQTQPPFGARFFAWFDVNCAEFPLEANDHASTNLSGKKSSPVATMAEPLSFFFNQFS